jgi:hypothetical protein
MLKLATKFSVAPDCVGFVHCNQAKIFFEYVVLPNGVLQKMRARAEENFWRRVHYAILPSIDSGPYRRIHLETFFRDLDSCHIEPLLQLFDLLYVSSTAQSLIT